TSSASALVTVNANATGLQAGTYYASILITPTGATTPAITVPVTFNVGSSTGGTGTLSASLTSVPLAYTTGGAFPSQAITLTSSTSIPTFSAAAFDPDGGWLLVNGNALVSTVPLSSGLTISAGVAAASLKTGTYAGYVMVTGSDGSTLQINVTLTVNNGTV